MSDFLDNLEEEKLNNISLTKDQENALLKFWTFWKKEHDHYPTLTRTAKVIFPENTEAQKLAVQAFFIKNGVELKNNNNYTKTDEELEKKKEEAYAAQLSEEQKVKILNAWNSAETPLTVKQLSEIAWPGENIDPRAFKGRVIREYLASLNIKPNVHVYTPKEKIVLTEEQKQFIYNNVTTMRVIEMAGALFPGKHHLNTVEYKAIKEYCESLPESIKQFQEPSELSDRNYTPPGTINKTATKINKYILNGINVNEISENTKIQENLKCVMRALHMYRFSVLINSYALNRDKELFEAAYIKYVWQMPDLNESELDIVCNLCCDFVNYSNMQAELEKLKVMRDDCLDDSEGKRLAMSLVEEMANLRGEMDENHKRQASAIKSLQGERNKRIEAKAQENASILQLVEKWREEKERLRLLKLAEDRKKIVKDELNKLDTLESYIGELFGVNRESF